MELDNIVIWLIIKKLILLLNEFKIKKKLVNLSYTTFINNGVDVIKIFERK